MTPDQSKISRGKQPSACAFLHACRITGLIMGQQLRKVAKRRRRIAYKARKKEAAKVAAITGSKR